MSIKDICERIWKGPLVHPFHICEWHEDYEGRNPRPMAHRKYQSQFVALTGRVCHPLMNGKPYSRKIVSANYSERNTHERREP